MSDQTLRLTASRLLAATIAVGLVLATGSTTAMANPKMVVDVRSGRVLVHQEAFRKWYPASLTKLMTIYVTFKAR